MKYLYPAVFSYDRKEDVYLVSFPDLAGCYTDGKTETEAFENAEDALNLMLWDKEDCGEPIPAPSKLSEISLRPDEYVSMIRADTKQYKTMMESDSIEKTVVIPEWLDEQAQKAHINFSGVLQDALKMKLGIVS